MRSRGFSLAEVLISSALLLVISTILVIGWYRGLSTWRKVGTKNELLTQGQRCLRMLERDLEGSSASSLASNSSGSILSFAAIAADGSTPTVMPDDFRIRWSSQLVYYRDSSAETVCRRVVAVPASSAAYLKPMPLNQIDLGLGTALSAYALDGTPVGREVRSIRFEIDGRMVNTSLTLGQQDVPTVLKSTTLLRNR